MASLTRRMSCSWLPGWQCTSFRQSSMPWARSVASRSRISVTNRPNLDFSPARVAPAARALAGQLDAHADARAHAVVLGVAQDQLQFGEVLDHRDDGAPELGGEDHRLDVARVLEAVADDQPVAGRFGHRHDRQQFGLGADLQAEAELAPVAVHLIDDQALLVDLDREYRRVAVAVFVLDDGAREGVVQVAEPVREDVGETHHHRGGQIARLQALAPLPAGRSRAPRWCRGAPRRCRPR